MEDVFRGYLSHVILLFLWIAKNICVTIIPHH